MERGQVWLFWSRFLKYYRKKHSLGMESLNLVIRYAFFFLISHTYQLGCVQFCFKSFQKLYRYVNLTATLQRKYYFYFIVEEVEAQGGSSNFFKVYIAGNW